MLGHMRVLLKEDVVGRRIADIIISVPDKPVTMSDMSYSPGYLKLDSGVVFDLGVQPLCVADDLAVTRVTRDTKYEREFCTLLRQEIEDVVLMIDDGCLCVVTRDAAITVVPAQFWVRPCIYKRTEFRYKTEPFWT
jgi:hypothetical protein